MPGPSKPEEPGLPDASHRTTPSVSAPVAPANADQNPQVFRSAPRQGDGDSGVARLAARAAVTGIAAVGFLIAGFKISPTQDEVPSAQAGSVVLLTNQPATHGSVGLWSHATPPTGVTADLRSATAGNR